MQLRPAALVFLDELAQQRNGDDRPVQRAWREHCGLGRAVVEQLLLVAFRRRLSLGVLRLASLLHHTVCSESLIFWIVTVRRARFDVTRTATRRKPCSQTARR